MNCHEKKDVSLCPQGGIPTDWLTDWLIEAVTVMWSVNSSFCVNDADCIASVIAGMDERAYVRDLSSA